MKGKLFLCLFALPFAAVGVGMLFFWVIPNLWEWQQMKSWQPINAQVMQAQLQSNRGSDNTTYKATATYRYYVNGKFYDNDRINIDTKSDNIGSYHKTMASKLDYAHRAQQPVIVWFDPQNPQRSVVDRDLRWNLLWFKMIFVLVFGGVGIGLLILTIKAKSTEIKTPEAVTKPWLGDTKWASATIESSAKSGAIGIWAFAIFWNLISSFIPLTIMEELHKGNYKALIALLFPLVGIGLLIAAIRKTLELKRFGKTPLTLDPHPGSIGGQVGGTIEIPFRFESGQQFKLVLACIHHWRSGKHSNQSSVWQETLIVMAEPGINGARVKFVFDVPEGVPTSSEADSDYHRWQLTLSANIEGVDLDRTFEIPVFCTKQKSSLILSGENKQINTMANKQAISELMNLKPILGGVELYFKAGRVMGMSLSLLVFGVIFFGSGIFIYFQQGPFIFPLVFGSIGALIFLGGLYSLGNSLLIRIDDLQFMSQRRIFGVLTKEITIPTTQLSPLTLKRTAQSGNTVFYNIVAEAPGYRTITIGESFKGVSEAKQALKELCEATKLVCDPQYRKG